MISSVVEALGAAVTGSGSAHNRRLGRLLLALITAANLLIFYNNVRNLLADENELEDSGGTVQQWQQRHGRAAIKSIGAPKAPPSLVQPSLPGLLPSTGEFASARQRRIPGKAARSLPVVVTVLQGEEQVAALRRLTGSAHHWHPGLCLLVYLTGDLPEERRSEVESWRDVTLLPAAKALRDLANDPRLLSASQGQGAIGRLSDGAGSWEEAAAGAFGGDKDAGGRTGALGDAEVRREAEQVVEWAPVALYHAVMKHGAAIYIEPWGLFVGWADHVFKALLRDGSFFVCRQPTGVNPGTVGFTNKSSVEAQRLGHQAACALGGPCAEQPAEVEGEGGPSKAIGLWDIDAEGMCHNSEEARIETGLRMANDGLDAEDPDALTALAGSPGGSSAMEQSHRLTARYSCKVRVKGPGGLRGEVKFSSPPALMSSEASAVIHIAVGVPSTTRGTQLRSPEELPVLNAMLPSMLATIEQQRLKYRYTLLFGYEVGDAVLDNTAKLEHLFRRLVDRIGDARVSVKILCFPSSGSTTAIWNGLFGAAGEEGADYFLAAHDDTEFTLPSAMGAGHARVWSDALVEQLAGNPMQANFGVAAPTDRRSPHSVTHPMVHVKTHHSIFGALFPSHLGNQEHEEWMSRVYGARSTFLSTTVGVYNGHRFSGRARGCRQGKDEVDFAVEDGAERLKAWAEEQVRAYEARSAGTVAGW